MTGSRGIATLIAGMMGVFLIAVDFTAANLALDTIQKEMHASLTHLQWIMNGYFLVFACLMVISGHLGDNFGHKKLMLIGVSIFGLSSLGAGLSPSVNGIILFRFLQGIGGALAWPSILALALTSLGEEKKGTALGAIMGMGGFATAFGPVIGGIFLEYASWRWIFCFNAPVSLVILFAAWFLVPKDGEKKREKIDLVGNLLLIVGLAGLLYALQGANGWGWGSAKFIAILVGSLFFIGIFLLAELKIKMPLFDTHWLGRRGIVGILLARSALMYGFCALLFVVAIYFQHIRGLSPLMSGLWFVPLTIGMGIIAPVGGRIVDHLGVKFPAIAGMVLSVIGFGWLLALNPDRSMTFFLGPFILLGFGMGLGGTSFGTGLVNAMPKNQIASAGGVYYMVSLLAGSVGLAVSGFFLGEAGDARLQEIVAAQKLNLTTEQLGSLNGALASSNSLSSFGAGWGDALHTKIILAVQLAFTDMLWQMILIFFVLSLLGLLAAIWAFHSKTEIPREVAADIELT